MPIRGIGRVEASGAGVTDRAVGPGGDRVARLCLWRVPVLHRGWETLCESQHNSGSSVNSTFAEYTVVVPAFATPVPDAVSSQDAAPLCAGVTTYKPGFRSCGRFSGMIASVDAGQDVARWSAGPKSLAARLRPIW